MRTTITFIIIICAAMCMATGLITYRLSAQQHRKIAVVDAIRLFDGYDMKKELEVIARTQLQKESKKLDSINNVMKTVKASGGKEEDMRRMFTLYEQAKEKLQQDYDQSNKDINTQVWKRLNDLLDEYGKKEGLHLIIGANGMGSVLYADDYYNVTNDAINFINKKYAEAN